MSTYIHMHVATWRHALSTVTSYVMILLQPVWITSPAAWTFKKSWCYISVVPADGQVAKLQYPVTWFKWGCYRCTVGGRGKRKSILWYKWDMNHVQFCFFWKMWWCSSWLLRHKPPSICLTPLMVEYREILRDFIGHFEWRHPIHKSDTFGITVSRRKFEENMHFQHCACRWPGIVWCRGICR